MTREEVITRKMIAKARRDESEGREMPLGLLMTEGLHLWSAGQAAHEGDPAVQAPFGLTMPHTLRRQAEHGVVVVHRIEEQLGAPVLGGDERLVMHCVTYAREAIDT